MNASKHTHTHTKKNIFNHPRTPTHMHTNTCVCTHMHPHTNMHACMHTCMHTHTHTHTHSHTLTHTHTQCILSYMTYSPASVQAPCYGQLPPAPSSCPLWARTTQSCHPASSACPSDWPETCAAGLRSHSWCLVLVKEIQYGQATLSTRWQCITLLLWLINISENGPVCWHC